MSSLFDDGLKRKNVVNGLMCRSKSNLTSSFKMSSLKLFRKLHVEDCSIEFQESVTNHDCTVVIWDLH